MTYREDNVKNENKRKTKTRKMDKVNKKKRIFSFIV